MDIIFANRRDCFTSKGGDTIQMLKTKSYLEKRGYNIKICTSPKELKEYKNIKIIHIFNIQSINDTLAFIEAAKKNNQKIVLSPIYWDLSDAVFVSHYFKVFKNIQFLSKAIIFKKIYFKAIYVLNRMTKGKKSNNAYLSNNYISLRKKVFENVDFIVPNSEEEWEIICKEFSIVPDHYSSKVKMVPNAIEIGVFEEKGKINDETHELLCNINNYVLQVGRIEPTKNQSTVIRALMNHPSIPVVFIGAKKDYKYYLYLKKMSDKRGNVYFIDELNQEQIFNFYKHATVHVLPSFRESPGLVSLEALFFDTEIVVSNQQFCPVNYYRFDEVGHICNPYDYKSVERAIICAFEKKKNHLKNGYFDNYSYEKVSRIMDEVYNELI